MPLAAEVPTSIDDTQAQLLDHGYVSDRQLATAATHDRIRGKDSFREVVTAIAACQHTGPLEALDAHEALALGRTATAGQHYFADAAMQVVLAAWKRLARTPWRARASMSLLLMLTRTWGSKCTPSRTKPQRRKRPS